MKATETEHEAKRWLAGNDWDLAIIDLFLREGSGLHAGSRFGLTDLGGNDGGYGDLLQIGDGSAGQNTLAEVPRGLTLEHLYVHGDPLVGQKRCIALNAAAVTIRDSFIADCKTVGQDSQAIGGWNGTGPYKIVNNHLAGAGENVMFGGADPAMRRTSMATFERFRLP